MTLSFHWCICLLFLICDPSEFLAVTQSNRTLPCDVIQNGSSVIFDCSARQLTTIPLPIKYRADSTKLNLSENNISTISATSFLNWINLTKINLNWKCNARAIIGNTNKCITETSISDRAFSSLTNLSQLHIDGNVLSKIPVGMPSNLTLMSLQYNKIVSIRKIHFSNLTQLKKLYLSHNCYFSNPCGNPYNIENDAFSDLQNLEVLALSFNNLTQVPSNLPSTLKVLYLSNNRITNISKDAFENLTNLEVLHLSGNCPRCFNAAYPCEPCSGNAAIQIDPHAFRNLKNLKKLSLASTSLNRIEPTWFENTRDLEVLNLVLNNLKAEISSGDFLVKLPSLKVLDLSFNYERQVYSQYLNLSKNFSKLTSLQQLHIKGYVFKNLDSEHLQPLKNLPELKVLNFGVNFIKQIDLTIFQHFSNLTTISLSENRITPYTGGNRSLTGESFKNHLVIQRRSVDNYIGPYLAVMSSDYQYNFSNPLTKPQCSSYGKTLDLSLNNIFFIDPQQFAGFQDVACLNLSFNGIGQQLNGTEFVNLPNLSYLDLSYNKLDLASNFAFEELPRLEVLDLSYNVHYFAVRDITHRLAFIENLPNLKVLNLSYSEISTLTEACVHSMSLKELVFKSNRLDIMWGNGDLRYLHIFTAFLNLEHLDISLNKLKDIPMKAFPQNLTHLYLNNNKLADLQWVECQQFKNLKVLDLSENSLSAITIKLGNYTQSLETLLLQKNRISVLADTFLEGVSSLSYLDLSYNQLQVVDEWIFSTENEKNLTLLLKGNPFECTCETDKFIDWIYKTNVILLRLASDVICESPRQKKGTTVISLDLSTCALETLAIMLFFLSFLAITGTILIAVMKHLFYWDAWYVFHFCMAKFKGYKSLAMSESLYDAFVTYDTRDVAVTDWIMNELRVHLEEKEENKVFLCLGERDWEPGKAIIDNLTESIHRSRKTIFVLTENYVKSGNFKTSFYLALQRLMDENMDVIVLILLQPVLQHSQYLRLRRKLCKSSILEWPRNPHAKDFFWQSLKNVVLTENCRRYNSLYKDSLTCQ
uniref:Toll-like receptor 8 n=1 Tax=Geotrypetes seraphini TaxID=260995 RepID=A0A6P8QZ58_GEOSA|nr:toll-like receptor 8 [Geotrypetes seraphini]